MAVHAVVAFWGVSLLLVLVPGADWAYAITAGLRDRSILPAIGGLAFGYAGLTIVVAAGVAAFVAQRPGVLTALTVLGAVYLCWLGLTTLARPAVPQASDETPARSWWTRAVKGAGISGLNPKGLLLFLALLPQFTDGNGSWPLIAQICVLGLAHVANCAVVYFGVGAMARTVLRARPVVTRAVTRFSGSAMILIGAGLVLERLAA